MDFLINKFRIELNNLIQDYREKGIPAYIISGVLAQEQVTMKEWELAEITIAFDDALHKEIKGESHEGKLDDILHNEIEDESREVEDEQGIQQS